jgi:hypothetical protein
MFGGGFSSKQLVGAGVALLLFGAFVVTRGSIGAGLALCAAGGAMLGKRFLSD